MDKREIEVIIKKKSILAQGFVLDINKYYQNSNQPPQITELIRVPCSLLLCNGNRPATREFLKRTNGTEGEFKLLDAIDLTLKKYIRPDDLSDEIPITELYLIESLIKMAVSLMIPHLLGVQNATTK